MADTPTPRKRRWWLVPLVLVVLLIAGVLIYRTTHLEQWSWFWASRNFIGNDIDAIDENNIYVVGNFILHYDGMRWSRVDYIFEDGISGGTGASLIPANAGKFLGLFYRPRLAYSSQSFNLNDVQAFDVKHVYAVGKAGIFQCDGENWSVMPIANGLTPQPDKVWVQNPTSIYALDDEWGVLHWDGQIWDVLPLPASFKANDIGGTTEHAIITGDGPTLLMETDGVWEQIDITPLISDIDLHEQADASYGLQPRRIWALYYDEIAVEICEYTVGSPLSLGGRIGYNTRALLLYNDGEWNRIDAPEWWQPDEILSCPGSCLTAYDFGGIWYQYVEKSDGNGRTWQITYPWLCTVFGGYTAFIDSDHLVVYGANLDIYGNFVSHCRVEYLEITHWQ